MCGGVERRLLGVRAWLRVRVGVRAPNPAVSRGAGVAYAVERQRDIVAIERNLILRPESRRVVN